VLNTIQNRRLFMMTRVRTTRIGSTVAVGALLLLSMFAVAQMKQAHATSNFCGPIDLAIVLDDTGSMGGAIANVKAELPSIIDQAQAASGPDGVPDSPDDDLRLGFVTFKDDVTVHDKLTTDLSTVETHIAAEFASGGGALPEASDEAKNATVNNLSARAGQTGDFDEPWRAGAVKIVILITDAPPGGFNDFEDAADDAKMHDVAVMAAAAGIKVSDVFVPTAGDYAGQAALLADDALTSGGAFITTAADGTGTAGAISAIIDACGGPVEDCSDENVLLADAGVISTGGTTDLTQKLDTCNGVSGTIISWTVFESDGDTCVADDLPAVVPLTGAVTREYPTEFTIAISGGDGECDTGDVGVFTSETQVNVGAKVLEDRVEFETNFFVIPESPIGVAALMVASLAALGGFMFWKRRSGSTPTDTGLGM
jgi:hypothetical protein